jgi:hypothetical protein
MKKVTLDTTVIVEYEKKIGELNEVAQKYNLELCVVSVTEREFTGRMPGEIFINSLTETGVWGESNWGKAVWGAPLHEVGVIGEPRIGSFVFAAEELVLVLETILKIISNGSFPPPGARHHLTAGERNQLRDALILEAHVRAKRDVFVSGDKRAFIGNEKIRRKLENTFQIEIMATEEFFEAFRLSGV